MHLTVVTESQVVHCLPPISCNARGDLSICQSMSARVSTLLKAKNYLQILYSLRVVSLIPMSNLLTPCTSYSLRSLPQSKRSASSSPPEAWLRVLLHFGRLVNTSSHACRCLFVLCTTTSSQVGLRTNVKCRGGGAGGGEFLYPLFPHGPILVLDKQQDSWCCPIKNGIIIFRLILFLSSASYVLL